MNIHFGLNLFYSYVFVFDSCTFKQDKDQKGNIHFEMKYLLVRKKPSNFCVCCAKLTAIDGKSLAENAQKKVFSVQR